MWLSVIYISLHQVSVYVQFLEGLCNLSELEEATRLPEMRLIENRVGVFISGYRIRFRRLEYLIKLDNGRLKFA